MTPKSPDTQSSPTVPEGYMPDVTRLVSLSATEYMELRTALALAGIVAAAVQQVVVPTRR